MTKNTMKIAGSDLHSVFARKAVYCEISHSLFLSFPLAFSKSAHEKARN